MIPIRAFYICGGLRVKKPCNFFGDLLYILFFFCLIFSYFFFFCASIHETIASSVYTRNTKCVGRATDGENILSRRRRVR